MEYSHTLNYNGSCLMAVPAVHLQSAFAEQVHNLCRNPETRPEAIAVELGTPLVSEIIRYLKELNQGNTKKVMLPCMLGIMIKNAYLHPSCEEKALLLQEIYQSPLHSLPEDVLESRLNFNKWSTIFLSPADSIIEAIRCGLELDIPVYGVDVMFMANAKRNPISIEDPQNAHSDPVSYANRIMKYCENGRDPDIDFYREVVMTAGLKYCLSRHNKVLFTCGMAHWQSITKLWTDENIIPGLLPEPEVPVCFKRVIIHPVLAAAAMEVIPQITLNYEKKRFPVNAPVKEVKSLKSAEELIRLYLDEAYTEYSGKGNKSFNRLQDNRHWSDIRLYEQYLFHLAAVKQKMLPDMTTMLLSAENIMDDKYLRILTNRLMKIDPDWASPRNFPNMPVAMPRQSQSGDSSNSQKRIRIKLEYGDQDNAFSGTDKTDVFYSEIPKNQDIDPLKIDLHWRWTKLPKKEIKNSAIGRAWVWPPCEYLIYGMGYKAVEMTISQTASRRDSAMFEGSMESGVNVKATIRSLIRGENKIYVNGVTSKLEQSIVDGLDPDPMVLIFNNQPRENGTKWGFYQAGNTIGQLVKNKELYKQVTDQFGHYFVASVHLEKSIQPPEHLNRLISSSHKIFGSVLFGNPCINACQSALWLEATRYKCCPVLWEEYSDKALLSYYLDQFQIQLSYDYWQESLVLMALPFAKCMVTIIAPPMFQISADLRNMAARRKIALNMVPLSNFSEEHILEAQNRYSIPTIDANGQNFLPESEILLSMKQDRYIELLPYEIRNQLEIIKNMQIQEV